MYVNIMPACRTKGSAAVVFLWDGLETTVTFDFNQSLLQILRVLPEVSHSKSVCFLALGTGTQKEMPERND